MGKNQIKVKVKKLKENAKIPVRGSDKAAAYDLYACTDDGKGIVIWPGETVQVGTGIAIAPEEGYFAAIYARSGLATKSGIRPANCVGIIDEDYRGEVMVALHNDSSQRHHMQPDERIAQMMILPYYDILFEETEALDETERGSGGFGSTGKI